MKIIQVEEDEDVQNLVATILETGYGIHSLDASNFDKIPDILEKEKHVCGIICPYRIGESDCHIAYSLIQKDPNKAFILFDSVLPDEVRGLSGFLENKLNHFIKKPTTSGEFISAIAQILPKIEEERLKKKNSIEGNFSLKEQKKAPKEGELNFSTDKSKEISPVNTRELSSKSKDDLPEDEKDNKNAEIDFDDNDISSGYKKVKIRRLAAFVVSPCDIYLRITSTKFLKIINNGDNDVQEVLKKYLDKDFLYIYIKNEDYVVFLENFGSQIGKVITNTKTSNEDVRTTGQLLVTENIIDQIKEMGVTDNAVKLANQGIDSVLSIVKKSGGQGGKGIANLLDSVMKGNDFISEHSLSVTYLCSQMGLFLRWDIKSTLEKISMAAMLHDSMISVEQSQIRSLKSVEASELSEEEIEIIRAHPEKIAEEVNKVMNMFPDVGSILIQHHERPDGSGFPRGLKAMNIAPLSALFIIAEEFVHRVYNKNLNKELVEEIRKDFNEYFGRGNFKKPLEAFNHFLDLYTN